MTSNTSCTNITPSPSIPKYNGVCSVHSIYIHAYVRYSVAPFLVLLKYTYKILFFQVVYKFSFTTQSKLDEFFKTVLLNKQGNIWMNR
jgi:hypothetical protein